ncbi:hypothetical protein BH11PLA1_BH11PLA1_07880 [soil metagenome]
MKTTRSMLLAAGTLASLAGLAGADYTAGPFSGPYNVPVSGFFQSIDLNAPSAPAASYGSATMTFDWSPPVPTLQWQDDSRAALTSAAVSGVSVIPGGVTIYYGGTNGAAPSTATANNTPGQVRWDNVPFSTNFVANGSNPLFFTFHTNYHGGSDVTWANVTVTLAAPVVVPPTTEIEPNEFSAPQVISAANGTSTTGYAVGALFAGGGPDSADFYRIAAAPHAGIHRHRATFTSGGGNQFAGPAIYGENGDGTIDTTAVFIFSDSATTGYMQWYTFGNSTDTTARSILVGIGGDGASTGVYTLAVTADDAVTPTALSRSISAGTVTISTTGLNNSNDTELFVLDSNYNSIPDYLNDDATGGGSAITRTFAAGIYYIGMGTYSVATPLASAADDNYRFGDVNPYAGAAMASDDFTASWSFTVTDSAGVVTQAVQQTEAYQIVFFAMTVGAAAPTRCQPADIADDAGNPLPSAGPNNGVNEGDYNAFFNNFFTNQAVGSPADIASDDGTPLPPFGAPGLPNNGVNEGDYNAFFNNFFNGCPV